MSNYIIDWQSGGTEGIPGKGSITLPEKQTNATATSLVLTGRGVSNYGETQQENFLRLLEHFASGNPPAHPTIGQLWFDYSATQLKLYKNVSTWDPVTTVGGNYAITGSWTFPAPTMANSPATKSYVDGVAMGLQVKPAVEVVVTNPGDLGAFTYNNGTAGVGATLTANANGAFPAIDGYTVASTVTGQNGVLIAFTGGDLRNGRYVLTQVGDGSNPWILTRCGLCDEASEIPGSYTFVKHGTTFIGSGWVQTVGNPVSFTVGTDPVFVNQFTNTLSYVAGPGISIVGNTISLQSGVVAPGTYTSVTVDTYGRVTAGSNPAINIDASQVVSGTLSDLRLSSNVALRNTANTFTANQTINSGTITALYLNSTTNSEVWFYSSAQPANNRLWIALNNGTNFDISAYNDSGGTGFPALRLTRTGNIPSYISTHGSLYVGELQTGVVGRISAVVSSDAAHTGHIEFNNVFGGREGYIGSASTTGGNDAGTIPYVAGTHAFTGNVTATGAVTAFGNLSTSGVVSSSGAGTSTLAGNLSVGGNLTVVGSAPGRLKEVAVFSTPGTTNYTPPAGTEVLEIIVVGAGGGGVGGGSTGGGGGGGGGASVVYYRNPAIAPWIVQVGGGGPGSLNSATAATGGGASTVILPLSGPTIFGFGGLPADGANTGGGGQGGFASMSVPPLSGAWGTFMQAVHHYGHPGEHGTVSQLGGMGVPGHGGASLLGRGGHGTPPGANTPQGGLGHLGGGGGGGNGTAAGGAGGDGIVIFKAYG
jgi:hypothetical protein